MPKLMPVESGAIAAMGYDTGAQELYVRFAGGGTYAYSGVPEMVYRILLNADSKGAYLNKVVKPRYPCREL
jgi:KTSC domain-containing protein